MWIKNLNNAAFSLLEVLLASIIFVISITGVFVTLTAVRKPVADKESALAAAVFGKQVLEALRSQVDARTYYGATCSAVNAGDGSCGDFSLFLGTHEVSTSSPTWPAGLSWPPAISLAAWASSNPGACSASPCLTYTVTCADGGASCGTAGVDVARQVNLSINWPDAP